MNLKNQVDWVGFILMMFAAIACIVFILSLVSCTPSQFAKAKPLTTLAVYKTFQLDPDLATEEVETFLNIVEEGKTIEETLVDYEGDPQHADTAVTLRLLSDGYLTTSTKEWLALVKRGLSLHKEVQRIREQNEMAVEELPPLPEISGK